MFVRYKYILFYIFLIFNPTFGSIIESFIFNVIANPDNGYVVAVEYEDELFLLENESSLLWSGSIPNVDLDKKYRYIIVNNQSTKKIKRIESEEFYRYFDDYTYSTLNEVYNIEKTVVKHKKFPKVYNTVMNTTQSKLYDDSFISTIIINGDKNDLEKLSSMSSSSIDTYTVDMTYFSPYTIKTFQNVVINTFDDVYQPHSALTASNTSTDDDENPKNSFLINIFTNSTTVETDNGLFDTWSFKLLSDSTDKLLLRNKLYTDLANSLSIPFAQATYSRLYFNNKPMGLFVLKENLDLAYFKEVFNTSEFFYQKIYHNSTMEYIGNEKFSNSSNNISTSKVNNKKYDAYYGYWYQGKEKADAANVNKKNDIISLFEVFSRATSKDLIQYLFNVDLYLKAMALEYLANNKDGFLYSAGNYYLFHDENKFLWSFHEGDAKSIFDLSAANIEYNVDYMEYRANNITITDPIRQPFDILMSFDDGKKEFEKILTEIVQTVFNNEVLNQRIESLINLIDSDLKWSLSIVNKNNNNSSNYENNNNSSNTSTKKNSSNSNTSTTKKSRSSKTSKKITTTTKNSKTKTNSSRSSSSSSSNKKKREFNAEIEISNDLNRLIEWINNRYFYVAKKYDIFKSTPIYCRYGVFKSPNAAENMKIKDEKDEDDEDEDSCIYTRIPVNVNSLFAHTFVISLIIVILHLLYGTFINPIKWVLKERDIRTKPKVFLELWLAIIVFLVIACGFVFLWVRKQPIKQIYMFMVSQIYFKLSLEKAMGTFETVFSILFWLVINRDSFIILLFVFFIPWPSNKYVRRIILQKQLQEDINGNDDDDNESDDSTSTIINYKKKNSHIRFSNIPSIKKYDNTLSEIDNSSTTDSSNTIKNTNINSTFELFKEDDFEEFVECNTDEIYNVSGEIKEQNVYNNTILDLSAIINESFDITNNSVPHTFNEYIDRIYGQESYISDSESEYQMNNDNANLTHYSDCIRYDTTIIENENSMAINISPIVNEKDVSTVIDETQPLERRSNSILRRTVTASQESLNEKETDKKFKSVFVPKYNEARLKIIEKYKKIKHGYLIVCHNSSPVLENTLESILAVATPMSIFIAENGSSKREKALMKKIIDVCEAKYRKRHPKYKELSITYANLNEGSKTIAQFALLNNLRWLGINIEFFSVIDDDVIIPSSWKEEEIIAYFDNPNVHSLAYPISASNRRDSVVAAFQDFEYRISMYGKKFIKILVRLFSQVVL